ncbi:hypothetical protein DL770_005831 [Monosporascus sp. CRB-9-2]|nr:hypothetical protein DL770_005831 [Monosporascus sp. CRB-9-2]
MSANPQTQSAFVNRLPREMRNAIYLELWRSCGLRQHILWHADPADRRFCRWPCAMEYEVQDELQRDIEELRAQLEVPLGQDIIKDRHEKLTLYCRRLQSPWINHWPCGEQAEKEHGLKAIWGVSTSYARSLKLSLSPDFPKLLMCANFDLPGIERRHDVYYCHWLRLDRFQNLQSINIWIAARSITSRVDSDNSFFGIKQFGVEALRDVLAPFGHIKSFTLSTPLGPSIRP